MPVKPPAPVPVEEFEDGFKIVRATMRGVTYVIRELPADEYEKCVEKSKSDSGASDNITLLKLMLDKALMQPKMTVAELWKLPYPIIRKLNDIINDLHFSFIETDEEKAEASTGEDDEKGKAQA